MYPALKNDEGQVLAWVKQNLALSNLKRGKSAEAAELYQSAYDILRKLQEDPCTEVGADTGEGLVAALLGAGRPDEAEQRAIEIGQWRGENCGPESEANADALALLARVAFARGRRDEGRSLREQEKGIRALLKERAGQAAP